MALWFNIFYSLFVVFYIFSCLPSFYSLSTLSISETSNQTLVCALLHSPNQQSYLNCSSFPKGTNIPPVNTNVSFSGIVAGNGFLCVLRSISSANSIMVCYRFSANGVNMLPKRIYRGPAIQELDAGNSHICGLVRGTSRLECWQWPGFDSTVVTDLTSVTVGENFVCGLLQNGNIKCAGSGIIDRVPSGKYNLVAAGFHHACAISSNNSLDCWGAMVGVKPQGEFRSLALGQNRSCALRINGTVFCWGEDNFALPERLQDIEFISIEAKSRVFCGIVSLNFSLHCWGNENFVSNTMVFQEVMPGPCRSSCPRGTIPNSGRFCARGAICKTSQTCSVHRTPPAPKAPTPQLPPRQPSSPERSHKWNDKLIAFLVVGCVGSLSLVLVALFFLFQYCRGRGCRIHDSGRLDDEAPQQDNGVPQQGNLQAQAAGPVLEKKLSHMISLGNGGHLEEFSLEKLLEVTDNFSEEHKIGTGSFGSVYRAKLDDGREVAIKRAEVSRSSSYAASSRRQEDKDRAFLNELESLSRLHHKNLVRLLGFCEDSNERVLVYEYMSNGTLHEHLHKLQESPLRSWPKRLKVALDAARGIEYLHVYAVPSIIHRDIKSSNILLDTNWIAKVSDFGLSLMGPQDNESHLSLRAAGTVGYMDPEYYRLNQLTSKSDVYSFGVVLLELLSGYKAIHKNENEVPRNVVDFIVPYIIQDEIHRVLDPNVPPPTPFEIEAVTYVGYLAADCVSLEGRDRPSMTDVVNSLERALAACLAPPTLSRSSTESST